MEQEPLSTQDISGEESTTEQGEQEQAKRGIWIVDDSKEHVDAVLRFMNIKGGSEFDFKHYQEGEQAVNDFDQLAEQQGKKPDIILMDYNLAQQVKEPKYRTGVEVIGELKRVADKWQIKLPEIIAFSSESSYAEKLIEAGATSSIGKSDVRAIRDLIESRKIKS